LALEHLAAAPAVVVVTVVVRRLKLADHRLDNSQALAAAVVVVSPLVTQSQRPVLAAARGCLQVRLPAPQLLAPVTADSAFTTTSDTAVLAAAAAAQIALLHRTIGPAATAAITVPAAAAVALAEMTRAIQARAEAARRGLRSSSPTSNSNDLPSACRLSRFRPLNQPGESAANFLFPTRWEISAADFQIPAGFAATKSGFGPHTSLRASNAQS
jgi:hypothetical protein